MKKKFQQNAGYYSFLILLIIILSSAFSDGKEKETDKKTSIEQTKKPLNAAAEKTPEHSPAVQNPENEKEQKAFMEKLKALYEKAKETGDKVPNDLMTWAKEDVNKFGTWEYTTIEFNEKNQGEMMKQINDLGSKRWECFWIEKTKSGKKMYFKKRGRSMIMAGGQIVNYIPGIGSQE